MARKKQLLQNATIFTEPPTLTKYSHNVHKENMKPGRKIVTHWGLHKYNGNTYLTTYIGIQNKKKPLTEDIDSYTLHNPQQQN